ncbi:potassium-transporting ATPase subunit KdpC [Alicyclobacillus fodiniaquatilis]|uniref:Potassium-transporting ATPase KdpC subunit n=1 Tax=Alicyclobacillus fodiniaquatilis TaxID=1661150 RepID=A0ABW4JDS2_9BACL
MTNVWRSIRFTIVFAILLGLIYPLVVTGISNVLFPFQSKGSMVTYNGKVVGSELIAEPVTDPRLFWPRPSAVKYAANGSGGSNYGPTDPKLIQEVQGNIKSDGAAAGTPTSSIPPDMVESSASGLDPDITIQDAMLQIPRIAKATGLSQSSLQTLVAQNEQGPSLGIWGIRMVNVMKLNLALEKQIGR